MAFKNIKTRVIVPVVEMTPMIDIIFLLIIFFMVAAQFSQQSRVAMALPQELVPDDGHAAEYVLVINLLEGGEIIVDTSQGAISLDALRTIIESKSAAQEVTWDTLLVRADVACPTEQLNDVVQLLHEYKYPAINIATVVE